MDFTKAFDSVVWDALNVVLQHFGFGQNLRRWIKVLFPGTLSSLMLNGQPLDPFKLGAGNRQKDPLSPALFVLFIEPFLHFCVLKCRDWVSNVSLRLIRLSVSQMTVLFS